MLNFIKCKLKRNAALLSCFTLMAFVGVQPFWDQNDLSGYCQTSFEKSGQCPKKLCRLTCAGEDAPDCEAMCEPRPCFEISREDCPLDSCQVMRGCNDEEICFYKMQQEAPLCGNIGYEGQEVECCEGLEKRCGVEYFDGSCDMLGEKSIYSVGVCLPCGNGICNQFENRCNCPEDCSKK